MALSRLAWRPKLFWSRPNLTRFASTGSQQQGHAQEKPNRANNGGDAPTQGRAGSAGHRKRHPNKRDKSDRKQDSQGTSVQEAARPARSKQNQERLPKASRDFTPLAVMPFTYWGKLQTTQENADFIKQYDLEWRTRLGTQLKTSKELRQLMAPSLVANWSPRHVINPIHLQYFLPRPHPMIPAFRHRYARMKLSQALWVFLLPLNNASSVVRFTARSRIKKAILDSLERMGYPDGIGEKREIRGTLWISDTDSEKTVNKPAALIGELLAKTLVEECSQERPPGSYRGVE